MFFSLDFALWFTFFRMAALISISTDSLFFLLNRTTNILVWRFVHLFHSDCYRIKTEKKYPLRVLPTVAYLKCGCSVCLLSVFVCCRGEELIIAVYLFAFFFIILSNLIQLDSRSRSRLCDWHRLLALILMVYLKFCFFFLS